MASKNKQKKELEVSRGRLWWRNSPIRKIWKLVEGLAWAIFLPTLGFFIKLYFWSLRIGLKTERHGPLFEYIREGKPFIITNWHDDPFPSMLEIVQHTPKLKLMAMASGGRTGRIGSYLLKIWRIKAIHGSSSGGGIEAIQKLTRKAKEQNSCVVLTADGSRGPLRQARWGAIYLAKDTGFPLIGFRGWARHNFILKWSWTKLALPIPWGKHVVLSCEPIFIPQDSTKEQLEGYRQELERRLNELVPLSAKMVREK